MVQSTQHWARDYFVAIAFPMTGALYCYGNSRKWIGKSNPTTCEAASYFNEPPTL
jgi:hypothetical protein